MKKLLQLSIVAAGIALAGDYHHAPPPPTPRDVVTPEPGTVLMMGTGLAGLAYAIHRNRKRKT